MDTGGVLPKHFLEVLLEEKKQKEQVDGSLSETTVSSVQGLSPGGADGLTETFESLRLEDGNSDVSEQTTCDKGRNSTQPTNTRTVLDYYGTVPTTFNDEEKLSAKFDYVLEVFGFHPALKTKDLLKELHVYGSSKMKLKWVDDTHALAIYLNGKEASIALKGVYSLIKVRPLSSISHDESKALAEKVAESIRESLLHEVELSVRPQRPQTTSSVARRMVGNALGIKINVTPEQRQQERSKLESAREEKRSRKQKLDQQF